MKAVLVGAVLGLLAVIAGAVTGHGPVAGVGADGMRPVLAAVRYHEFGAVMIVVTALAAARGESGAAGRWLVLSSWLFVAGTLLFSFSIYARTLLGFGWLAPVTPLGGLCHIIGWMALGWAAVAGMPRRVEATSD